MVTTTLIVQNNFICIYVIIEYISRERLYIGKSNTKQPTTLDELELNVRGQIYQVGPEFHGKSLGFNTASGEKD